MGVFIYPCKIKEKISDIVYGEDYNKLLEKYEEMGEEILPLEGMNEYNDFISPFEEGIYTYESSGKHFIDLSYSSNIDFLQQLERIGEDNGNRNAFSVTLSESGIDNCISYTTAEKMLAEFEKYKGEAEKHFVEQSDNDYGEYMWNIYNRYIEVLKDCIEIKGVVRYH